MEKMFPAWWWKRVWFFWVYVSPHKGVRVKWRFGMISVSMQVGQKFTIGLTPIPPNGVVDGPPNYVQQVGGLVSVAPSADGMSAEVVALAAGVETITVKGLSLGNPIAGDDSVVVTITPAPVPATALHVTVGPVS